MNYYYISMNGTLKDKSLHTSRNQGKAGEFCSYGDDDDADNIGPPLVIVDKNGEANEVMSMIMKRKGKVFTNQDNIEIILNDVELVKYDGHDGDAEIYTTSGDFFENISNLDTDS